MANLAVSATFAGQGSGNLTALTPLHSVWYFDETGVTWDTDVTAATEAELETAMGNAQTDVGTAQSPKYHRIMWTGGTISGNKNWSTSQARPAADTVYTLVDGFNGGSTHTSVTGTVTMGNSVCNVKFRGFQFEATGGTSPTNAGINLFGAGNGARLAFSECRFGRFWAGGAYNTFGRVFAMGTSGRDWELSVRDCEFRNVFECFELGPGKFDFRHNLATGIRDDFISSYGRSHGQQVYMHVVGNVICDHEDNAADTGWHCDFIQCADSSDGASDSYYVQAQGNIFIGSTYQQYPTMASIIQNQGAATDFTTEYSDNIFLCTGTRGFWLPNRQTSLHRNLHAWPPLGGAVPTSGTGWNGGPFKQRYRAGTTTSPSTPYGLDGDVDIGHYWAADTMANTDGWGAGTIVDPAQIIDHTASLGGATAYDQRFPNMTGLAFNGSTLIIDNGWSSVARTKAAIRNWVSNTYEPNTVANGTGWAANGFNDPAGWFA